MATGVNKQQGCKFCRECGIAVPPAVPLDGFVNKQRMRFWAPENPYRVVETSFYTADCTV